MSLPLSAKDDLNCLVCHSYKGLNRIDENGKLRSYYVDPKAFDAAVHAPLTCETCHDYIKQVPHLAENIRPVDCSSMCHLEDNPRYGEDFSHKSILSSYLKSQHGPQIEDTPRCNDCHLQHQMTRLTEMDFRAKVSLCSSCHADETLMKKHNKSTRPVKLYNEGVHRRARYFGDERGAYCVSCHNPHEVMSRTNPDSNTYPDNRIKICSQEKCHPKATTTFANNGAIHNSYDGGIMALITEYLPPIYFLIVVGTIGFMLFHNGLDFLSYVFRGRAVHPKKPKSEIRYYERMTLNERIQHFILLSCFITLTVTGFMLKIPREWILNFSSDLNHVYTVRWYIHRAAASIMFLVCGYHVFYLAFTARGRSQFKELLPTFKDAKDIAGMFRYYFGLSRHKPRFEHFDYKEKLEYWALVWGNFIMVLTGSLIWFKIYVPKSFIDVAFIVHSYEAALAVLAILVWHFYAVHWKPGQFPMSMVWITGKLSEDHFIEEHAGEFIKVSGSELPEHHDVKYSRTGPVAALIFMLILSAGVYLKAPQIKDSLTIKRTVVEFPIRTNGVKKDIAPSFCKDCHGSYPHKENTRLRAFANFHANSMFCETCHLEPKEKNDKIGFGWYNDGEIVVRENDLSGIYPVASFIMNSRGDKQSLLMNKDALDTRWRISRKGLACQNCHFGEGEPGIDFAALGFDEDEQFNLTNSKALGMLIKRKIFYFYAF